VQCTEADKPVADRLPGDAGLWPGRAQHDAHEDGDQNVYVQLSEQVVQLPRIFTTTLIASSTRSRAYRNAVGSSQSGNVWV
jgi:hypothetical protein